jgi:hypothetical protein
MRCESGMYGERRDGMDGGGSGSILWGGSAMGGMYCMVGV